MKCPACDKPLPIYSGECPCGYRASAITPPLPPHRYPAWLIGSGLLVAALLITSLYDLPRYWTPVRAMRAATKAANSGDHATAASKFEEILQRNPDFGNVRMRLAMELYKSPQLADHRKADELLKGRELPVDYRVDLVVTLFESRLIADHLDALRYLRNLKMSKSQWQRVSNAMPDQYRRFITAPKGI